jgi:hypothetical protein
MESYNATFSIGQKRRREFNVPCLEEAVLRDNAVLTINYDNVTSKTVVGYTCNCGGHGRRRVDRIVDFGAYCASCAKSFQEAKKQATLATPRPDMPVCDKYVLTTKRDAKSTIVAGADTIQLTLAPGFRGVYIRDAPFPHRNVVWWDMVDHRTQCKLVRADDAEGFAATKLSVPDDYRVTFKIADILPQLARI